jgi:hypothetical protein
MTIHEWVAKMLRHRTVRAEKILMLASGLWPADGSKPVLERSADHQSRGAAPPSQKDRADSAMGTTNRSAIQSRDSFNIWEIILAGRWQAGARQSGQVMGTWGAPAERKG